MLVFKIYKQQTTWFFKKRNCSNLSCFGEKTEKKEPGEIQQEEKSGYGQHQSAKHWMLQEIQFATKHLMFRKLMFLKKVGAIYSMRIMLV